MRDDERTGPPEYEARAEAEIRVAELTAVIRSIPDAVYIGTAEGISLANEPAAQLLGFDSTDDLNQHIHRLSELIQVRDLETGEPIDVAEQAFGRALRGETARSEVVVRHLKTGEDRIVRVVAAPVLVGGEVAAAVAVNSDVTEQRRAAREAEAHEQRLRLALRAANAGTWDIDMRSGRHEWSEEFYSLHGLDPATAASAELWLSAAHAEDRDGLAEQVFSQRAAGDEIDVEYRVSRAGEIRWINTKGQVLCDGKGRAARMIGLSIDTTERKRAEENLRSVAHTERNRAESLAELDRFRDAFLAVAGHELRNPLATIKGYTQMIDRSLRKLREEGEGEAGLEKTLARQSHFVEQSLRQIDRMSSMLNQLFDLAGAQNHQLTLNRDRDCDMVQLVLRVVAEQRLNNLSRTIEVTTTERAIEGNWDEARIEQVLNNLIGNAIKYSPANTPVLVQVDCLQAGEEGREVDEALVSVRDFGYGINVEDQPHIFERFYRAHTPDTMSVKGLGVGLYISAEIIRLHGGRIWVESTPGEGSTFYFLLPTGRPG